MAAISSLDVGSIHAADMTTIIAPAIGTTNVLGMNFLSSLEGWRVEGKVMILTPKTSNQT
jgi:aspartyl protease family protein